MESIRRFEVESQRSVLKIEECTLLPLTEFQRSRALWLRLAELVREADIPGRDLPAARRAVSGLGTADADAEAARQLRLLAAGAAMVLWDEPDQIRGAADRFWKRLEQIERVARLRPE